MQSVFASHEAVLFHIVCCCTVLLAVTLNRLWNLHTAISRPSLTTTKQHCAEPPVSLHAQCITPCGPAAPCTGPCARQRNSVRSHFRTFFLASEKRKFSAV